MYAHRRPNENKPKGVQAVSRALRILDAFSKNQTELSLNDISIKTGFYKSTILRLTQTMIDEGYLIRDPETGKFKLGIKVYLLGQICSKSLNLLTVSLPFLEKLVENSKETLAIYIIQGIQRVCLTKVQSPQYITAFVEEGQQLPLHAGAAGKLLLAYSDESFVQRLIDGTGLRSFTEKTITNSSELKNELARIREAGYAFSQGERDPSAAALAAPIFKGENKMVGALSLSGPSTRFGPKQISFFLSLILEAAEDISHQLGYSGSFWEAGVKPAGNFS